METPSAAAYKKTRTSPSIHRAVTPRMSFSNLNTSDSEDGQVRYVRVTFEVTANTGFGEAIYVVIDVPELGGEHIQLLTSPEIYPIHRVGQPIALRAGTVVSYRYAKYRAGQMDRYEDVKERTIELDGTEKEQLVMDVIEELKEPIEPRQGLSNSPTIAPILRRHSSAMSEPRNKPVTLSASEGVLVVSFYLPCKLTRVRRGVWTVEMDENSILYREPTPNSSILDRMMARYVGVPPSDDPIPLDERVHVTRALQKHGCIPVYLSSDTASKAMDYCTGTLRNVFYGFVDVYGRVPTKWWNPNLQNSNWFGYLEAGKAFAEVVQGHYDDRTLVWVHGYELIPLLPQLARKLHATARRVGFTLHRPFPSSEIFRTLSVRVDLLRAILSADVITFHLYEYVRHFTTCARRILGIEEEKTEKGCVILNVDGRRVTILPIHGGVDVSHIMRYLRTRSLCLETRRVLESERRSRVLILGLDFGGQMDGIKTKLLAFERLLKARPELASKVCFVEKVIEGGWGGPGGGGVVSSVVSENAQYDYTGLLNETDDEEDDMNGSSSLSLGSPSNKPVSPWCKNQCLKIVNRINTKYATRNNSGEIIPVVYLEILKEVPTTAQRLALFAAGDILFQTPLREGISLFPFEFCLASAQTHGFYQPETEFFNPAEQEDEDVESGDEGGRSTLSTCGTDEGGNSSEDAENGGESLNKLPTQPVPVMVLSEFSSHVSILTGAIRVNPWRVETVYQGLCKALDMGIEERISRFQIDLETVRYKTATRWAEYVLTRLKEVTWKDKKNFEPDIVVGMGLNIRLIRGDKVAAKLQFNQVVKAFTQAKRRLLLLDYGGTTVLDDLGASFAFRPRGGVLYPSSEMVEVLAKLANSNETDVYIVSGRQREELSQAFGAVGSQLGLVAEHGFYIKNPSDTEWKQFADMEMQSDWMDTAISLMEVYTSRTNGTYVEKKESMVLWQYRDADPDFGARQAEELQLHLQFILQQFGVSVVKGKGYVEVRREGCDKGRAGKTLFSQNDYDFILAMGDDQADEPMFEVFNRLKDQRPECRIFTCVVGVQNRSSAEFHVDEVANVLELLQSLQHAFGYRHVGSVLGLAGINLNEDGDSEDGDDYEDSNFGQFGRKYLPELKISRSLPDAIGTLQEEEGSVSSDVDEPNEEFPTKLTSLGRSQTFGGSASLEDRPPSF